MDYPTSIVENLPPHYYPLVHGNESTLLTIDHYTNLTSAWTLNITAGVISSGYVSSTLSVNGETLAADASKYNLSQTATELGLLKQVINLQYNLSDEGFYVQHLYFDRTCYFYSILGTQGYGCLNHYYYANDYLGLYVMSLTVFPFMLTTYSKLSEYI